MTPLVSTGWLLESPDSVVLDATYYLPNEGKNARELYLASHIPGAGFFDLDTVCDQRSNLPHMLPSPEVFASAVTALGVDSERHVVVYDQRGLFSAARLWWMFRVFGHDNVAVLNGGLPAWRAAGGAVEAGEPVLTPGHFTAAFRPELVRSLDQMRQNLETGAELVLDARATGRFNGSSPEPRAGLRAGHIPGAKSLPFGELLTSGFLLPPEQLRSKFTALGVADGTRTVASCGSGVTAAVLVLAAVLAGLPEPAIYDGSWSEWGGRDDTPIDT